MTIMSSAKPKLSIHYCDDNDAESSELPDYLDSDEFASSDGSEEIEQVKATVQKKSRIEEPIDKLDDATNVNGNYDDDSDNADDECDFDEDSNVGTSTKNAGWSDAISKILKANTRNNVSVLSKAKKIKDVRTTKPKPAGFEVETVDGEVKEQFIEEKVEETTKAKTTRKKKNKIPSIRVKPNILEKDRERILTKIATKGVVQLFNSVRMQQKEIKQKLDEAKTEVQKEKALKNVNRNAFLDVLMGKKSESVQDPIEYMKKKESDETWDVLKDDFMMKAKMKDWDKQMDVDEEEEKEVEMNAEYE